MWGLSLSPFSSFLVLNWTSWISQSDWNTVTGLPWCEASLWRKSDHVDFLIIPDYSNLACYIWLGPIRYENNLNRHQSQLALLFQTLFPTLYFLQIKSFVFFPFYFALRDIHTRMFTLYVEIVLKPYDRMHKHSSEI